MHLVILDLLLRDLLLEVLSFLPQFVQVVLVLLFSHLLPEFELFERVLRHVELFLLLVQVADQVLHGRLG